MLRHRRSIELRPLRTDAQRDRTGYLLTLAGQPAPNVEWTQAARGRRVRTLSFILGSYWQAQRRQRERDARGVGGRLFSVGRGLSRRVIALLSFVQILIAASVVVR